MSSSVKPESLLSSLIRWTLISTSLMIALGVVFIVFALQSSDSGDRSSRDLIGIMFVQVVVGVTMGILFGLLDYFSRKIPVRKPKGTLRRRMLTAGVVFGLFGTLFALANGAPLPVAVLIGGAVGAVLAAAARIGFERAERDWANRMGGDGG